MKSIFDMKGFYEIKDTNKNPVLVGNTILDIDNTSRRVKVAISNMGNIDHDGDVIDGGAYTKTLKERGPQGSNMIWHLTDHHASFKSALGKFSELYIDGTKLLGITNIPNTSWGNDMLEFYKDGHINQHSIGFKTIKNEQVKNQGESFNLIKEIFLYEGSAVLWAANEQTETVSVGKSLNKEEAKSEILDINKELLILTKSMRDGRYTDDSFEMIDIRISQLNQRIKNLMPIITAPEEVSVQPTEPSDNINKQLNNILNLFK